MDESSKIFPKQWMVDSDYGVVSGTIMPILEGKPVSLSAVRCIERCYFPAAHPEIANEFAALSQSQDSEVAVLAFVRRFGLLGFREAMTASMENIRKNLALDYGQGNIIPPAMRWNTEIQAQVDAGDPVSWIIAHAKSVRLVMSLAAARRQSEIEQVIEELTYRDEQSESRKLSYLVALRPWRSPLRKQIAVSPETNASEIAGDIVTEILNSNLGGVRVRLHKKTQTKPQKLAGPVALEIVFEPECLLDSIYWHVAQSVAASSIKRCTFDRCRKFFIASNPKAEYCPDPNGGKRSLCATRARQQRYRDTNSQQLKLKKLKGRRSKKKTEKRS